MTSVHYKYVYCVITRPTVKNTVFLMHCRFMPFLSCSYEFRAWFELLLYDVLCSPTAKNDVGYRHPTKLQIETALLSLF